MHELSLQAIYVKFDSSRKSQKCSIVLSENEKSKFK